MSWLGGSDLYANKVMLAPMVHAGRTPLRLLALDNGADLVYTEEIVDQKLLSSTRIVNGTVDYMIGNDVVLRIATKREKDKCIVQVGTNDADRAALVAKLIGSDAAGIDLNMGCPRAFSLSGGMGAALLAQPDKVKQILTSLVSVSTVPVSCKIRVLDKLEDTLSLVQLIEKCGVSAIGVHGRRKDERRSDRNRTEEIREVARSVTVPVIANGASGTIMKYDDIEEFRSQCSASSVMVGRKALTNPSIFRKSGILATMDEEIENFLKNVCEYDENFTMTKYVVQRILGSAQEFDPRGQQTVNAASVFEICKAWSMEKTYGYYKELQKGGTSYDVDPETGICFIDVTFPPRKLRSCCGSGTPKSVLNALCDESQIQRPIYHCKYRPVHKRYEALIEVAGKKFLSRISQPNKKMAEQVAALAALIGIKQRGRLRGDWEE